MTLKTEHLCSIHHEWGINAQLTWSLKLTNCSILKQAEPAMGSVTNPGSMSCQASSSWDYQESQGDNSTLIISLSSNLFLTLTPVYLFQSLFLFLNEMWNLYVLNNEKNKTKQNKTGPAIPTRLDSKGDLLEKSSLCCSVIIFGNVAGWSCHNPIPEPNLHPVE